MGEALGTEPMSNSSSMRHPPAGASLAPTSATRLPQTGHTTTSKGRRRGPDTDLSIPAVATCVQRRQLAPPRRRRDRLPDLQVATHDGQQREARLTGVNVDRRSPRPAPVRPPLKALIREAVTAQVAAMATDPLHQPLIYGDATRLHIHPTAVINNALFNPVFGGHHRRAARLLWPQCGDPDRHPRLHQVRRRASGRSPHDRS
jgi:hypothetical protein